MTTNISEEELLLRKRARRRLVGAIVLVLVSIIVLPAIFDEPKSNSEKQEIAINLPVAKTGAAGQLPNNTPVIVETLVDEDPSIEFKDKMLMASQANDDMAELPSDRKHIPIPGIKPKIDKPGISIKEAAGMLAEPAVNTVAFNSMNAATPAAADTSKGLVIQLGAYSDQAKAKQQQTNLIASGFKAYTEIHNGMMRVRIGPFATRVAAENEMQKLKKMGLDGVIVPR